MCIFVTGTLPAGADIEAVRRIGHESGCATEWRPLRNPRVEPLFPAGLEYYWVTGGICDCDVALGSRRWAPHHKARSLPPAAHKWSEAKKFRWLAQQAETLARKTAKPESELDGWARFLAGAAREAGEVGLLLHHYHGSIESERVAVVCPRPLPVGEVTTDLLLDLRQDTLHRFRVEASSNRGGHDGPAAEKR